MGWLLWGEEERDHYSPRINVQGGLKVISQKTTDKCNNHCLFCVMPECFASWEKNIPPPSTKDFITIIDGYSKDGRDPDVISFTTAEPTMRSDIIYLLEYTVDKYPKTNIRMLTNGRMFSHRAYVKRFKGLFLRVGLDIPLHGSTGAIHDGLTGVKRSFDQTVQGLKNIFDVFPGASVNIRVLVHQQNYQDLIKLVAFIRDAFPKAASIILIYISMIGDAKKNSSELLLKFLDLKEPMNRLLRTYCHKMPLALFNFPFCVIDKEHWALSAGRTLADEQIEFAEQCFGCLKHEQCCGLWKSELNAELFTGLSPIKEYS